MTAIYTLLLSFWFVLALAVPTHKEQAAALAQPSFLFIIADDLGTYDLKDPSIDTPNLDTLRSDSAVFSRAYNTSPMCSPSRTCLLGQYGRRVGIGRIIKKTEPNDVPISGTIATTLSSAGYSTCFVGKWHLSSGLNYSLNLAPGLFGFQNWRAVASHNPGATVDNGDYYNWGRIDDGAFTLTTEYIPVAQANAAVSWWQTTAGPKLLWLSFSSVHSPLHEPPRELYTGRAPITDRDKYEAMVEALDSQVGVVLSQMNLENTYVFFSSDNGTDDPSAEAPQQIGKLKGTMYEGGIRTPFYVRGPGVRAEHKPRRLVSTVDYYATVIELANAQSPFVFDSISFADAISTLPGQDARGWIFAERFGPNGALVFNARERTIIREDGWKLLVEEDLGFETKRKLFHLFTDPLELNSVFNPIIDNELQALLNMFP